MGKFLGLSVQAYQHGEQGSVRAYGPHSGNAEFQVT
jgi:hypothetical protein